MRIFGRISAIWAAALLIATPALADLSELDLGGGDILMIRDAGFVQVQYNDEGFGMTVDANVVRRQDGADDTTRAVTEADLRQACALVLKRPEARIGSYPPDYIFFQVVKRRVDAGLIKLDRTEKTFFETRRDRCRQISGAPEEVK